MDKSYLCCDLTDLYSDDGLCLALRLLMTRNFGIPLCPPQMWLSPAITLFALHLLDTRLNLHTMPPITRTTTGKLPVVRKHVDDEILVPLSDTDSNISGHQGLFSFYTTMSNHILTSLPCITALEPNLSTSEMHVQKSAKWVKITVAFSQHGESKNAKLQGLTWRKQGYLCNFLTMPLDILFEVCKTYSSDFLG